MTVPHPAPVIADVLEFLAQRLEARATRTPTEAPSLLDTVYLGVAEEIRATIKEIR